MLNRLSALVIGIALCLPIEQAQAQAQVPNIYGLLLLDDGGGGADTAQIYYIHTDHLNTPRLIANQAGQTVWRWDNTEPFGNSAPDENPSGLGEFTCNLRYPGQYFDKETNLHYNYVRDYDSAIGRFIQSDPIGLAGGINTYAYVGSDPLGASDPSGLLSPALHEGITMGAASSAGISSTNASYLAQLVVAVDPPNQGMYEAYMHSMCAPRTPMEACRKKIEDWIKNNLGACDYQGLAYALHAIQDSFGAAHTGSSGPRTWRGTASTFFPIPILPVAAIYHAITDYMPSRSRIWGARRATEDAIKAWQTKCQCR